VATCSDTFEKKKRGMAVLEKDRIFTFTVTEHVVNGKGYSRRLSTAWGMHVLWSQPDCLCFAWVQLSDDSPPKEKAFKCFLATPSFYPAVLSILLLSAITGPKFPFYKDVSPLLIKMEFHFYLRIRVCMCTCVCNG